MALSAANLNEMGLAKGASRVDCLFCGYRKDRIANVTETDPANDGKADERCEQQKAKADFLALMRSHFLNSSQPNFVPIAASRRRVCRSYDTGESAASDDSP